MAAGNDHPFASVSGLHHVDSLISISDREARKQQQQQKRKAKEEPRKPEPESEVETEVETEVTDIQSSEQEEGHVDFQA